MSRALAGCHETRDSREKHGGTIPEAIVIRVSLEDTAAKPAEVSDKAQENIRVKEGHRCPLLTARKAAAAVDRERGHRQPLRSTPAPRQ